MLQKPFRTPLLTKSKACSATSSGQADSEPQPKKRRISNDHELVATKTAPRLVFKTPGVSCLPRKPLLAVQNPAVVAEVSELENGGIDGYYNVLW